MCRIQHSECCPFFLEDDPFRETEFVSHHRKLNQIREELSHHITLKLKRSTTKHPRENESSLTEHSGSSKTDGVVTDLDGARQPLMFDRLGSRRRRGVRRGTSTVRNDTRADGDLERAQCGVAELNFGVVCLRRGGARLGYAKGETTATKVH